jgi:glucose-6-phosphate 1-dehydrogenase
MRGDQTLFPRSDWIYEAWGIVDPIVKQWEEKPWHKFPNYVAGTWGPEDSDLLLKTHNWNNE